MPCLMSYTVRKSPKSTLCDRLPGGGSPGRSVTLNLLPQPQKTKFQKKGIELPSENALQTLLTKHCYFRYIHS